MHYTVCRPKYDINTAGKASNNTFLLDTSCPLYLTTFVIVKNFSFTDFSHFSNLSVCTQFCTRTTRIGKTHWAVLRTRTRPHISQQRESILASIAPLRSLWTHALTWCVQTGQANTHSVSPLRVYGFYFPLMGRVAMFYRQVFLRFRGAVTSSNLQSERAWFRVALSNNRTLSHRISLRAQRANTGEARANELGERRWKMRAIFHVHWVKQTTFSQYFCARGFWFLV